VEEVVNIAAGVVKCCRVGKKIKSQFLIRSAEPGAEKEEGVVLAVYGENGAGNW